MSFYYRDECVQGTGWLGSWMEVEDGVDTRFEKWMF